MSVQTHYYCPQCGYDLSGQQVERCPECNFYYDQQALHDLLIKAFNEACEPCIRAAQVLAPAGCLALAAHFGGSSRFAPLVSSACMVLFLLSPYLIGGWVTGELGFGSTREMFGSLGVVRSVLWINCSALVWFATLFRTFAVVLTAAGLLTGLVLSSLSLAKHRQMICKNQISSLPSAYVAILYRARMAAWILVFLDAGLLAMLAR